MEYVLNHTRDIPDTSGQPDRRMRPQSAFAPRQSYFKHKGEDDDIGRSVLQHKPLAKGEFTQLSLAKVFEDDPGMRPKVFASPIVNKISYGLLSRDIDGAMSAAKVAPFRARDTDPNTPRYILPGALTLATEAAAAAAAAAAPLPPPPADGSIDAPTTLTMPRQQPQAPPQPPQQNTRDTLDVSDINRVDRVSERPHMMETRHTQLTTRDVEGCWPGWEPPFRAHVGKNLRDPGLDVSDISGTHCRRRILSARPTLGSSSRGSGSGAAKARDLSRPPQDLPPPEAAAAAMSGASQPLEQLQLQPQQRWNSGSGLGERQQQQQPESYLPPPLTWQPVQYDMGGQQWSSEGSSNGSSGTTRRHSHPARQQQQQQSSSPPQQQQQQQEEQFVHAAGAWPTTVTLPLRPAISPPPFATHIPTGSVAAVLSAVLDPSTANRTAAVADHPAATVGKPSPAKRDVGARHAAKVTLAEVQRADAAEAHRVISSLLPSREAVEEFYSSCRRLDRESCGKVAPTDFIHALERANLLEALIPGADSTGTETPSAAAAAAAKALTRGFQDGCGMVSYRYLAKALLGQTSATRRSSSKAMAAPVPTPAAAAAASMPAPVPIPASTAAAAGSATAVEARILHASVQATSAAGAALGPPLARQSSDGGNTRAARPGSAEGADGAAASTAAAASASASADGSGSMCGPAGPVGDTAAAAAATAAAAGSRRFVNWAPDPQPAADGSQGAVPATPLPQPIPRRQDQRRMELQERQLQRENSSQRRRPYSAVPGGGGGPKGAGAVAAVFKLLGAQQPILYDTPQPQPVHVHAVVAPPSAAKAPAADPAAAAAAAASSPAAGQDPPKAGSTPSQPEPHDGMGFGPHWPPEPRTCNLQKRSTATIMEGSNLQLRDVCDVSYFPYKAHALWFGGRVGPDGAEARGGPGDAAREYQPSVDPTSFIVGKGHHRIHITPSGRKLEPEVEAAIVTKLRPKSSVGGSPEATARVKAASSVVDQLNLDNPLLYPGHVDPTTPAGEALKGMMGALYSKGTHGGGRGSSGARGAVRPSTAGPRYSMHSRLASVSRSMSAFSGGGGGGGGEAAAGGGGSSSNAAAASAGGGGGAARVGRVALERQIQREELAAVRRLC